MLTSKRTQCVNWQQLGEKPSLQLLVAPDKDGALALHAPCGATGEPHLRRQMLSAVPLKPEKGLGKSGGLVEEQYERGQCTLPRSSAESRSRGRARSSREEKGT